MISLFIDNSECQLTDMSVDVRKQVKELLSYKTAPRPSFRGGYVSDKRYMMDKQDKFPTGLLYMVEDFFKSHRIQYNRIDDRKLPKRLQDLFTPLKPLTPYPTQTNAAKACLRASRGIVAAPTGSGKTLIAALIVKEMQVPTLIVVPSLELKRQTTEAMKAIYGEDRVGALGSPLAIENVDALDPKKPLKGYGCVIIDEFHHSGAKTYRILNKYSWSGVYYKFGLTATPFRSQSEEKMLLESVLSNTIYKITYKEAVDNAYIVPMEAYWVDVPITKDPGNKWMQVYSKLVVHNEARNEIIKDLMGTFSALSTLTLVKEIAHGKHLEELTAVFFIKGENDNNAEIINLFNSNSMTQLIGTTGVLGEGVDTKPAEVIIIAGLGKSRNAFMQQVGRGFRKYSGKTSCKIIIFRDKSHKWTLNHFKEQCTILKQEYGVVPNQLIVDKT